MKNKIHWVEFVIDIGDTLSGIGIGISSQTKDMSMLYGSVFLLILSTFLKFRKYKK